MKLRIGFISNSSTCSFVICKSFIPTQEKVDRIINWYKEKSAETYMDDCGSVIKDERNYITGTIAYVIDDFFKLMKEMAISPDEIILIGN
jgi:hypothetical protein